MREGFNKLIWGFVFLFDFRLGGFDILPDPIAYLLIFLGMTSLMGFFKEFKDIRFISIVLLFTSIPSVFQEHGVSINSSSGLQLQHGFFLLIGVITSILSLILMYTIFMGISRRATEYGFVDLAGFAKITWILTLVIAISVYIAIVVVILAIPIIILGFVNFILQIVVLIKAKDAFLSINYEQDI